MDTKEYKREPVIWKDRTSKILAGLIRKRNKIHTIKNENGGIMTTTPEICDRYYEQLYD